MMLWVLAGVLVAFELAWGPIRGLCMANDDLKFVRSASREVPLLDALADAWMTLPSFRPMEVIVAHLSDPVTLECPWVPLVQGAGLLVMLAAVVALVREALPDAESAAPIALVMVLLSPATTASVWQMDSCSQTWSAALGAWSVWLAWRWLSRSGAIAAEWWVMIALCAAVAVGLTVKENFYGWSTGLMVASVCNLVAARRRERPATLRGVLVLVPVGLIPVVHFIVRWKWSALPGLLGGAGESRYEAEFGANLLLNAVLSMAASVGVGPFHLVVDGDASSLLRTLPIAASAGVILMIVLGVGLAAIQNEPIEGVRWRAIAFASSACVLSLCATIPMASVSELYGLGANVGGALLAVGAAASLWCHGGPGGWLLGRVTVGAVLAFTAITGGLGLASRAHHFSVVWRSARLLNDAIVRFQPTLPAARPGDSSAVGMVHVPTSCLVGTTHSQYVMPPLQVLDLNLTEEWLARRDPARRIVFSIGTSPRDPRPNELVLDCTALPRHGHW